jgi:transcriptional regulator
LGGTYAAERQIAEDALRAAGVPEEKIAEALKESDDYFSSIGVHMDTPLRIPGNRQ